MLCTGVRRAELRGVETVSLVQRVNGLESCYTVSNQGDSPGAAPDWGGRNLMATIVVVLVQEFAELNYEVLRRSLVQQVLGLESHTAKQHAIFYVGLSVVQPARLMCSSTPGGLYILLLFLISLLRIVCRRTYVLPLLSLLHCLFCIY